MTYKNDRPVAILLSTYNGEQYLSEQLDSLFSQSFKNFTLYVRDDGSSDRTREIISTYAKKYDNLVFLSSDGNLGPAGSFGCLMDSVDSEYYMFCDQDDVWRNDKTEVSFETIRQVEKSNPGKPVIVYTDLNFVDENLNPVSGHILKEMEIYAGIGHSIKQFCHFNDITGCTMMFNRNAVACYQDFSRLLKDSGIQHDYFLGLCVSCKAGVIVPIFERTIYYRRHGGTVTDPLHHSKSIFLKPHHTFSYMREFYKKYGFMYNFNRGSFLSFTWNKIKVTVLKYRNIYHQNRHNGVLVPGA